MNDACPVCNKKGRVVLNDGRDFFIFDGKTEPFGMIFCEDCYIGYSTPYLTDLELSKYYPEDYEAYQPKRHFNAYLQTLRYKRDLKIIMGRIFFKQAAMLEIGAGRGEFLAEAKKKGFLVEGVEPGEAGRKYAKEQFGVSLTNEFASNIEFKKRHDIIVMRHVLEHINKPEHLLEQIINDGLNPGGLLFLKLPRLDSWEAKCFGRFWSDLELPRHRIHFTKKGIIILLRKVGFHDIRIRPEVTPLCMMRGIRYFSRHGNVGIIKFIAKAFVLLPNVVQIFVCQATGFIAMPWGAGRMIVSAKKSEKIIRN